MKGPVELTKAELRLVPSGILEAQIEQMTTGTQNESGLWLLHGKPPIEQAPSPDPAPPINPPITHSSFLHRHGKRMAMGGMALAVFIAGAATPMIMRRAPAPPQTATSLPVEAEKSAAQPGIPGVVFSSEGRQASRPTPAATQVDPSVQMQAWWSELESKLPLPAMSSAVPPQHRIEIRRHRKPVEAVYHRNHLSFAAGRTAAPLPATDHCPDSVCLPWIAR